MATTCIRNADWVIAWDGVKQRHGYLRNADIAFEGNKLLFVGNGYPGSVDREVTGSGLCAMPGLINIHCHPSTESFFRGIREEHGVPEMYMSGSVRTRQWSTSRMR